MGRQTHQRGQKLGPRGLGMEGQMAAIHQPLVIVEQQARKTQGHRYQPHPYLERTQALRRMGGEIEAIPERCPPNLDMLADPEANDHRHRRRQ